MCFTLKYRLGRRNRYLRDAVNIKGGDQENKLKNWRYKARSKRKLKRKKKISSEKKKKILHRKIRTGCYKNKDN